MPRGSEAIVCPLWLRTIALLFTAIKILEIRGYYISLHLPRIAIHVHVLWPTSHWHLLSDSLTGSLKMDSKKAPAHITRDNMSRKTIVVDPLSAHARLKEAVLHGHQSRNSWREELASICGWQKGFWGRDKIDQVYTWSVCSTEIERFKNDFAKSWDSRVPTYRVVQSIVNSHLINHTPIEGQEAEAFYARFVVRFKEAMDQPRLGSTLVVWIKKADLDEQIYIIFHLLLLVHYEEKDSLWRRLPVYAKALHSINGRKAREL